MNNLIVFPMVLPLITGVLLVFFSSYIAVQRWTSFIILIINSMINFAILHKIQLEGILSFDDGDWLLPFVSLVVADSFVSILGLTTNIVSAICILYAMKTIGEKR